MRRILVPLDGTPLAASILPDARRLAGPEGELILIRDAGSSTGEYPVGVSPHSLTDMEHASEYLEDIALGLTLQGTRVEKHTLAIADRAYAIDTAAQVYKADAIACATHGRGPLGRLVRGSTAWRALVNSTVPVLLRHVEEHPDPESIFAPRRTILVPLDGSEYAERALPLASELSSEWNARILLVQVIPTLQPLGSPFSLVYSDAADYKTDVQAARHYLDEAAGLLGGPVVTRVLAGGVVEELVHCVEQDQVTDIVLASHGRTGLSRVLLGSIADGLIQRLHCPIIVLPALAPPLAHGERYTELVTSAGSRP